MRVWIRYVAVLLLALGFLVHGSLVMSAAAQVGTCKRVQVVAPFVQSDESKAASGQMQAPPCKLVADRVGESVQDHRRPASISIFALLGRAASAAESAFIRDGR